MELKSRNVFLIVTLGCLWVTGKATNQAKNRSACFCGRNCSDPFSVYCNTDERIFITRVQLGFKSVNNICSKTPSCQNCCQPETNDCFEDYPESQFSDLYNNCWNHACCLFHLQDRDSICTGQNAFSTFLVAEHMCLKAGSITQFYMKSSITSSAVAIQYDPRHYGNYPVGRGHMKRWYCLVDTVSRTPCQVDVILVKDSQGISNSQRCSLVGWSGGPSLSCTSAFQYRRLDSSTPFWVSVTVDSSESFVFGWAVVRARSGEALRVKCGFAHRPNIGPSHSSSGIVSEASTVQTSSTSGAKTSATMRPGGCAAALSNGNVSTPVTSSLPSAVTSSGSTVLTPQAGRSASTGRSVKTTTSLSSIPPTPTTQTTASSRQPSSSGTSQRPAGRPSTNVLATLTGFPPTSNENKPKREGNADRSSGESLNQGALVGGIVAGVVVLAMGGLAVFCYVRQRRKNHDSDTKSVSHKKPSAHLALTPMDSTSSSRCLASALDPNEGSSQGLHGTRMNPAEKSDYDRLGQKKSQSSSSNPAATYGRLGEVGVGGEDTDNNYDHLARGRQAAPDVINPDYDTSKLHMTSEGDYDVAGIPKKQHVITGSDYDVAQIVTSEGDYNRVDFQGKKQRIITGSDYDVAEIVTSEGDYNRVDFMGKKQRIITGSDYDVPEVVTSAQAKSKVVKGDLSADVRMDGKMYAVVKPRPRVTSPVDVDYDEARTMVEPAEEGEYSAVWECDKK